MEGECAMKSVLSGFLVAAWLAGTCLAQPTIPKERIPADAPADVREQIEKLYSANADERSYACRRLGEMREKAGPAVPFLVGMLADKGEYKQMIDPQLPPDVRPLDVKVAETLGAIGPAASEALVAALRSDDARVRLNAAIGLCHMRTPPVDAVVVLLSDERPETRAAAAVALGKIARQGKEVPLDPLAAAVRDKDAGVRAQAALALGLVRGPKWFDALAVALGDPEVSVRRAAIEAATQHTGNPRAREAILAALGDKAAEVRLDAARVLAAYPYPWDEAVEPLMTALRDKEPQVRAAAAVALGRQPSAKDQGAIDPLLAALKDQVAEVRAPAARALGRMRDGRALDPLLAALKDPDASVRAAAAAALGGITDPRALDAAIAALKEDPDPRVRSGAAKGLGEMKDPGAVEPLAARLREEKIASVRGAIAEALYKVPDARALDAYVALLADEFWMVRERAAVTLGLLKDPRAVPALVAALKRNYYTPGLRPLEWGQPDRRMRDAVVGALVAIGKPSIEPLIPLLDGTRPQGRRESHEASNSAAEALKQITGQNFGQDAATWEAWWKKQAK
jgi:HEAT repeat protein